MNFVKIYFAYLQVETRQVCPLLLDRHSEDTLMISPDFLMIHLECGQNMKRYPLQLNAFLVILDTIPPKGATFKL